MAGGPTEPQSTLGIFNLPTDTLSTILRHLMYDDVHNLCDASHAMRRLLRPALYELHLERCVKDFFMRPKLQPHDKEDLERGGSQS